MSDAEDIADLQTLGSEVAGALQSAREPGCVVRAFASPLPGTIVVTMQRWMDLEAVGSPIVAGCALETDDDLHKTAAIFELNLTELDAEAVARCAIAMERAGLEMYALTLKMRQPGATGGALDDGCGTWLPLMAFLLAECHVGYAEAQQMPVTRAFGLMAAVRRNQGWDVVGEPYAMREVVN